LPLAHAHTARALQKFFVEQPRSAAVQPLLLNPSVSNFPAPPVSWSDIARACRRVCVLRERGNVEEAERLRTEEITRLIAAVRSPMDTDAALAAKLDGIFAAESERVANAMVLAELLAPMLSESAAHVTAPRVVAAAAPVVDMAVAAPAIPAAAMPPAARAGSIADFIDEMIAQENPPPRGGGQRRAS
jgi:hypothetical protein